MIPVLQAVPNFSEGRDTDLIEALVDRIAGHDVEVLDWSADPDHHRCVVTFVGAPAAVEEAAVAAADFAVEHFDLRRHRGVHPRVGALDVLPFVPLQGLTMSDAVASARRVGARLARAGLPVFLYARASDPPGRALSELRRGGFEAMTAGFPPDRRPDFMPAGADGPHPTAGVACVGARPVLLAWNVFVEGITLEDARRIAAGLRERGGGFPGLRALGLHLPRQDRMQISMNLEDPHTTDPTAVFEAIEAEVAGSGGRVAGTQVIGMIPDALVYPAAVDRLNLLDFEPARLLSSRVAEHAFRRFVREVQSLTHTLEAAGDQVPEDVREALGRIVEAVNETRTPDDES